MVAKVHDKPRDSIWDDLPDQVNRHYESFARILREDGYEEANPSQEGLYGCITHILWLLPLAEILQQHPYMRHLYPLVHHAVIELKRQPHDVPQQEAFIFYADAEGHFQLTHSTPGETAWQPNVILLGEGSAEEVVDLLTQSLQKQKVS